MSMRPGPRVPVEGKRFMDQPAYLRRLIEQKYILIVGAIVALVAGFFAGFEVVDGEIESRAVKTYVASSTVLLTGPEPVYFQVEIPAETETVPSGVDEEGNPVEQELIVTTRERTALPLSDSAIILAYMASSDDIVDAVAADIGELEDGEDITAVRRTTQPTGDERFGGRLELPLVEIAGISTSPDRAEAIAGSATAAFEAMVVQRQQESSVPEDIRIALDELNAPIAQEQDGSNPAIPSVVVGFGVFLLFIALALIVGIIRDRRLRRRRSSADEDGGPEEETGAPLNTGQAAPTRAGRRNTTGTARDDVNEPAAPPRS